MLELVESVMMINLRGNELTRFFLSLSLSAVVFHLIYDLLTARDVVAQDINLISNDLIERKIRR